MTEYWIRLVNYFHDMRWRDFNRVRNDWAKLDDWQKRYGTNPVPDCTPNALPRSSPPRP